jgi:hypothetical protein
MRTGFKVMTIPGLVVTQVRSISFLGAGNRARRGVEGRTPRGANHGAPIICLFDRLVDSWGDSFLVSGGATLAVRRNRTTPSRQRAILLGLIGRENGHTLSSPPLQETAKFVLEMRPEWASQKCQSFIA